MINHRTVREAYERGKNTLSRAGLESPAFDALCLLKEAFGIGDRATLAIHGSEPADPEKTELFEKFSDVKNHASKTNDICKELSNYFKLCYFDSDDVFTYYEGFWDTLNSFYDELHKTYTSKREYNMLKEKVLNQ